MKTIVGPRRSDKKQQWHLLSSDSSFFRSVFFKGDKRHSPSSRKASALNCDMSSTAEWALAATNLHRNFYGKCPTCPRPSPLQNSSKRRSIDRPDESSALDCWLDESCDNTKTYAPGFWCQEDVRKMSGSVKVAQSGSKWLKVAQSGSSIPYELIKTYMSLALRSLRDGAMPLQESSEQWPRQTWDMPRELAWRRPIRWSRKGSKTEKNEDEPRWTKMNQDEPRWTKMNQGDIRRSGEENAKSHL